MAKNEKKHFDVASIIKKITEENPAKKDEATFFISEFGVSLTKKQIEILNKEDEFKNKIILERKKEETK